jgi:hypothetical protein
VRDRVVLRVAENLGGLLEWKNRCLILRRLCCVMASQHRDRRCVEYFLAIANWSEYPAWVAGRRHWCGELQRNVRRNAPSHQT